MKRNLIVAIVVLAAVIVGFVGYKYATQSTITEVPPVPVATAPAEPAAAPSTEQAAPAETATQPATAPIGADILQIEVAGQANGVIEIQLSKDLAPDHVARIEAIAEAGGYDGVVFHRVIDGFMAQTGDVEFGKMSNDNLERAGMGGSDLPDLKAEFSTEPYIRGVVGMARGSNPDSANSQFFIMFADAPYLNGQYTVVGHVIAGLDVLDAIKKGDSNANGAVLAPADYMKRVRLKAAQ